MNIRQTPMFAKHLQRMGWLIDQIDGENFFIRKLPLLPPVIKLQRPEKLPKINKIYDLMRKYRAKRVDVEPHNLRHKSQPNIKLMLHPYNQTKTILIDLTVSEKEIFNRFDSAKRRAVRRAEKNQVQIDISQNVEQFIKLKNKSAGWILPWLTNWTVNPLWKEFAPKNVVVLLAYVNNETGKKGVLNMSSRAKREIPLGISHSASASFEMTNGDMAPSSGRKKYLGGILLLHAHNCAYYWMAGYTKAAKNLAAPTLLVFEALKYAKKIGCTVFDFEGVYDERLPHQGRDWQGFTRFKSGFGGEEFLYPLPYYIYLP